jgi:hypothetical protein
MMTVHSGMHFIFPENGSIINTGKGGIRVFSKKDAIFYMVVGNIIALIAGFAGANVGAILMLSLLVPPVLLLIIRLLRLF